MTILEGKWKRKTLSVGVDAEKQREREIERLSMGAEKKEERADARRQKIAASDGAAAEGG